MGPWPARGGVALGRWATRNTRVFADLPAPDLQVVEARVRDERRPDREPFEDNQSSRAVTARRTAASSPRKRRAVSEPAISAAHEPVAGSWSVMGRPGVPRRAGRWGSASSTRPRPRSRHHVGDVNDEEVVEVGGLLEMVEELEDAASLSQRQHAHLSMQRIVSVDRLGHRRGRPSRGGSDGRPVRGSPS